MIAATAVEKSIDFTVCRRRLPRTRARLGVASYRRDLTRLPSGLALRVRRIRRASPVNRPVLVMQLPFVCSEVATAGWRRHTLPNMHSSPHFAETIQTVSSAQRTGPVCGNGPAWAGSRNAGPSASRAIHRRALQTIIQVLGVSFLCRKSDI